MTAATFDVVPEIDPPCPDLPELVVDLGISSCFS